MSMASELDKRIARHMARQRGAFRGKVVMQQSQARVPRLQVKALALELLQGVEYFQHFGFASRPPAGTEVILLAVGGKTAHTVAIASENGALRLKNLADGESALYNKHGDYVLIKDGRVIALKAEGEVVIDAPNARCTGNLHVAGNITCEGDVSDSLGSMTAMRGIYDGHTHLNGGLPLLASATPLPLMVAGP